MNGNPFRSLPIGSLAVMLIFAGSLLAAPLATSIEPSTGQVPGGMHVMIHGSGFAICDTACRPPVSPVVTFTGTAAASVRVIDATTLDVVTPPLLPATYDVSVVQPEGQTTLRQSFKVTGDPLEAFEPLLLPIFSPPVRGAFGSEFHTFARAANNSGAGAGDVQLYGVDFGCLMAGPALLDTTLFPVSLRPGDPTYNLPVDCSNWPARVLYTPQSQAALLSTDLRVADVTRNASSHGTEIPVLRSSRLTNQWILLLDVPIEARFRNTLRIYALRPTSVQITTVGNPVSVALQPGRNIFEPAYAEFSAFPIPIDSGSRSTIRVLIEPALAVIPGTGTLISGPPVWAFITVTNNETQEITTISPD